MPGADRGRLRTQMVADDDGGVAVGERRRTGEQMVGGGREGVLVGATVDLFAFELFGGRVVHRADRHVGTGQIAGLADPTSNTEVGQHDSFVAGLRHPEKDVCRLDVPVQQPTAVGVIEGIGDIGDDVRHVGGRNPVRVLVGQQPGGIGAINELHGDPQLAVEVTAVVDGDDVRVPQHRHHLGFPIESLSILVIMADTGTEHLERIVAGQARMRSKINLAHSSGAEDPTDAVTGEDLAVG